MRSFDDPKHTPSLAIEQGRHILVSDRTTETWIPLSEIIFGVMAKLEIAIPDYEPALAIHSGGRR